MIPLALARCDVADYVSALFLVYIDPDPAQHPDRVDAADALLQPRLRAVARLHHRDHRPLPEPLPALVPPIGGGGFALDLGPIVGLIVLFVPRAVVVGLIEG